jgi:[ribosomal protein S18]-alanine N-acetyltransferase
MKLEVRPLTNADAREMIGWHYDPPYDAYDPPPESFGSLVDPSSLYFAVDSEADGLVGFCCFGDHARVPGNHCQADDRRALDVGVGLRPNMTGRGFGQALVAAVLDFARARFRPAIFRVTIAETNRRSVRVFERAGFELTRRFALPGHSLAFFELERASAD